MRYFKVIVAVLALGLSGCLGSRQPLNPPQLVTDRETDMAIQLFMQATILMAKYYGYESIDYDEVRERSQRSGFSALPFMPPIARQVTPPFKKGTLKQKLDSATLGPNGETKKFRTWADTLPGGYPTLLRYYVTTGWKASQIVCRNYLLGLDEKNQYFEFLQREFGIAFGLANTILALADANGTLRSAFAISQNAMNQSIDAYQDYRFLPIVDREAARELVENAQNQIALDFLLKIDGLYDGVVPTTRVVAVPVNGVIKNEPRFILFSDAIHAISSIEYQCTRSGVRNLVALALRGAAPKVGVDPSTSAIRVNP